MMNSSSFQDNSFLYYKLTIINSEIAMHKHCLLLNCFCFRGAFSFGDLTVNDNLLNGKSSNPALMNFGFCSFDLV